MLRDPLMLRELNMSVSAFSRSLSVSRQTLHAVLAERSGISPEIALRLGVLLGNGAQLWVDMQKNMICGKLKQSCTMCCNRCNELKPITQLLNKLLLDR